MSRLLSLILVVSILLLSAPSSWAAAAAPAASSPPDSSLNTVTSKRLKIVAKAALYGLGGGLVVGLASEVFVKKTKNIFMFGSLGMYAGIILGLYVISTSATPAPFQGQDTYEDFSWNSKVQPEQPGAMQSTRTLASLGKSPGEMRMTLLDLKF